MILILSCFCYRIVELIFEGKIGELNAKTQHFGDCEKKIEQLAAEIDRLKTVLSEFQEDYSRKNVQLSALEEEVLFNLVIVGSASLIFLFLNLWFQDLNKKKYVLYLHRLDFCGQPLVRITSKYMLWKTKH